MKNYKRIICFLITCLLVFTTCGCGSGSSGGFGKDTVKKAGNEKLDEKSLPKDMPRKMKKEMKKIYEEAYEDEMSAVEYFITEYAKNYKDDMDVVFDELIAETEDFYQEVNDFDPELKDVLAETAGEKFGDSALESHLIEQGVGVVLSDTEMGRGLRNIAATLVFGGLEFLLRYPEDDDVKRKDALVPVAVGTEYALVRSGGTVSGMLEELDHMTGYSLAVEAIDERITALKNVEYESPDNYSPKDKEYEEGYRMKTVIKARVAALKDNKKMRKAEYEHLEKKFLSMIKLPKGKIADAYLYFIIDKTGKQYGAFYLNTKEVLACINEKGDCSLRAEGYRHCIIDKNAEVLYEDQKQEENVYGDNGTILYSDVTPSGSLWKLIYDTNYDLGDHEVLYYIKPNGDEVKVGESKSFELSLDQMHSDYDTAEQLYCSNYYKTSDGYLDMSSGKIVSEDGYNEARLKQIMEDPDGLHRELDAQTISVLTLGQDRQDWTKLNDKYFYHDNIVCDSEDKEIKSLEDEGMGVYDIIYQNGKYWVLTNSGWLYTMNDNFEKTQDSVQIGENDLDKCRLTRYGLLKEEEVVSKDDGYYHTLLKLLDENGEEIWEIPDGKIDDLKDYFIGNNSTGWYLLGDQSKKLMLVTMDKGLKELNSSDSN